MRFAAAAIVLCIALFAGKAEAWNWKTAFGGGLIASALCGGIVGGIAVGDDESFWPYFGMGALCSFPVGFILGGIFGKDKNKPKPDAEPATALLDTKLDSMFLTGFQVVVLPDSPASPSPVITM